MSPEAAHRAATAVPPEAGNAPAGHLVNLSEATVLKAGNVYAVAERDGSVPLGPGHPLGVYLEDCRFLSGHELWLGGVRPRLLVTSAGLGSAAVHELTNPPLTLDDGSMLPLQTLQLRFERAVAADGLEETLRVESYDRRPVELQLELRLAADFEPMLAVRGILPGGRAQDVEVSVLEDGVRLAAQGRDGVLRSTTVCAEPAPAPGGGSRLRFPLRLRPGQPQTIRLRYALEQSDGGMQPAEAPEPAAAWLERRVRTTTDDQLFDRVLRRSLLDLRMLTSRIDGHSYYAAGIPWFATLFGRDSLITAIETLSFDPSMAEQTLRLLAATAGRRDDPAHDEEPGKVLHEMRVGEVARLALSPLARYYGTVDATPLFLCLLADHADWSGSLDLFRELRGPVDAMLGWIDGPGDRDRDGLLEYATRTPDGLRNQGWKDSDDGIVDARGVPLEPPITLVEPQAYVVRAKRAVAGLLERDGDVGGAARLRAGADAVAERIERFWLPGRGYYAMALGGDGRPSAALASNQGHLLWAGAVPPERARAIRDALMGAEMFSGWGIRTLGEGEPGFNPVGYHLGTVWPHDTAMIAFGLRRYGFDEDFLRLLEALLEAASHSERYRLPELFAGFSRAQFETPVPYPVACQPQAWAAGALPYLFRAALGIEPEGLDGRLRIRRPSLPEWLNRVEVRGLRIAGSTVDLLFERTGGGEAVALTDARIDGDVEVVLEITGDRRHAQA